MKVRTLTILTVVLTLWVALVVVAQPGRVFCQSQGSRHECVVTTHSGHWHAVGVAGWRPYTAHDSRPAYTRYPYCDGEDSVTPQPCYAPANAPGEHTYYVDPQGGIHYPNG